MIIVFPPLLLTAFGEGCAAPYCSATCTHTPPPPSGTKALTPQLLMFGAPLKFTLSHQAGIPFILESGGMLKSQLGRIYCDNFMVVKHLSITTFVRSLVVCYDCHAPSSSFPYLPQSMAYGSPEWDAPSAILKFFNKSYRVWEIIWPLIMPPYTSMWHANEGTSRTDDLLFPHQVFISGTFGGCQMPMCQWLS